MSSGPTVLPSAFGSPATTPDRGGVIPGMQPSGARSSWATTAQNGRPISYNARGGRSPLPYIKDLQDQAAHLEVDETSPISLLLTTAAASVQQSQILLDGNQVGQAYVHYLRASEIVVNLIPRHGDYRTLHSQHPNLYVQFQKLMLSIRQQQSAMDTIKQQIIEDNLAHNLPRNDSTGTSNTASSSTYVAYKPTNGTLRMPSPTDFQRGSTSQQENALKLNRTMSSPEDILAQRFARLRASQGPIPTNGSAVADQSISTTSRPSAGVVTDYPPRPSPSSISTTMSMSPGPGSPRPFGPRAMGASQYGPGVPVRKPLDTANVSLPRAPDPAYNPIWSAPSQPPQPNPPRKSTESIQAANTRYSQLAESRMSSPSGFGDDENPYRSRTPNGIHLAQENKPTSTDIPHNTTIRAQLLLEYMRKYNVLVIDVRPRDLYDSGHIYARSIICIEPVVLKENVSAEELEERLIVSPEHEQSLFERRNEFDLVVYYDQNTDSVSYLAGSPVGHGRPPALLVGGLDAWEDLVGSQSLATSSTAAIMGSLQTKRASHRPERAFGRVPSASANSSLEIRKRRLREFTPLNHEELTAWMERAKNEEIKPGVYQGDEAGILEEEIDGNVAEEPPSPFVRSYEDFLRRFPEPQAIQQSMVVPEPRAPVTSTPNYASPVPVAPSRPPPAMPRPSYGGVSDGRQIQPTLARQNSATKAALYTSNSFMTRLKLPRTGLTNFGVTCYMNSTLQCLSSTAVMSKFFIDDRFRYYVQKNWKGSQGVMPGLYANLIRSLWKNDVEVIIPTSFRNFCGRLNREWAIDRQQDAKEFFDFLVDCLHEDLNINWQRTQLRPLTFEEEMQRERMPVPKVSKIEWDRYCHREESFISSLFAGQHASRLKCTTCKRTSTTYEAFYSISVEIPHTGTGDIYQCLRSYCQEEMLSGDEVWKCPYCKCERVATKQIIITRAPQILVIHLKRFSASKTQSARKIHTPVDFPLHGLRMDNFVIPYPAANPEGDSVNGNGGAATPSSTSLSPTTPPFTYDAYGVLRHLGSTLSGGHYISLVRDAQRQCWRRFDDERVSDFNPRDLRFSDRLQNEQAYILFYERVPAK
uniref:Ubiquitin carboxyl-terminal hydrolase 5 n=1 Tax=Talaromyces marneffei PM1 TaxID=1077442 RepID=A0A093VTB7_TALMA